MVVDLAPLQVPSGKAPRLDRRDPGDRLGLTDKASAREQRDAVLDELEVLHGRLWAEAKRSVLLVLQGLDTVGEGRHDPPGAHGSESAGLLGDELQGADHPRARARLSLARAQRMPGSRTAGRVQPVSLRGRPRGARARESSTSAIVVAGTGTCVTSSRCSTDEGTTRRSRCSCTSPARSSASGCRRASTTRPSGGSSGPRIWKLERSGTRINPAYEEAITATSTDAAPWWVVPGDHKWVRDVAVATLLLETFRRLDPQFPPPDPRLDGLTVE